MKYTSKELSVITNISKQRIAVLRSAILKKGKDYEIIHSRCFIYFPSAVKKIQQRQKQNSKFNPNK